MAESCPICHETFDKPKFLQCGHTFCESCLDNYMDRCNKKEYIICPMCRSRTQYSRKGACYLMDNYFASHIMNSRRILLCLDCCYVTHVQLCLHCRANFCDSCLTTHELSMQSNVRTKEESLNDESVDEEPYIGNQGLSMLVATNTTFRFKKQDRIVVPSETNNALSLNLNVSLVLAYGIGRCYVVPKRSNVLIYYIRGE